MVTVVVAGATGEDTCERYTNFDPGLLGLALQLFAAPLMLNSVRSEDTLCEASEGTARLAERLRFGTSYDGIVFVTAEGDSGTAPGLRLIAMPEM